MTLDPRITFSRASLGTYYGADGLLKYAGHNLTTWSEDFSNAVWAKNSGATVTADAIAAPTGPTTADRLNHVTAGTITGAGLTHSPGGTLGQQIFSVYVKAGTKNWVGLGNNGSGVKYAYFNLATGVVGTRESPGWDLSGIENVGGGWYRCYGRTTVFGTQFNIRVCETDGTLTCTSPGDIYIWGGQIENVTTATTPGLYIPTTTAARHGPRFDHHPITHAPLGLLIEWTAINGMFNSEDFTQASHTKTGLTVTANQTTAPDGTPNADLVTASASPASITRNFAVADGRSIVMSVFVKKATTDWFYLCGLIGTPPEAPKAYFNLATGVVGTVDAGIVNAGIQSIGNGWYRCFLVRLAPTGGTERWNGGPCDANGSDAVTVGKSVYLWGAQFEDTSTANNMPTSYIPTAGSNVTRSEDRALMTGTNFSSWYNATGTFVVDFDLNMTLGTRTILYAHNNPLHTEYIWPVVRSGNAGVKINDLNVTQVDLTLSATAASILHKIGISFAANDVAACVNGGVVSTDLTAGMPDPNLMLIGDDTVAAEYLNGHIRRIRFWNTAKSDADLQALTAP